MTRHSKSPLHQLERQARLTLVLLPLMSGFSWFDSEVIALTFGQSMSQLNFVAANRFAIPDELPVISRRRPKTKEDLRTYNREYQRARRRRLKIEKLEKERQAIADRINQIRREE